jgi:hypothetical protein
VLLIRFRCDHCPRRGDAKLAACAARYGEFVTIGELLQIFRRSCPNSPEIRSKRLSPATSQLLDVHGCDAGERRSVWFSRRGRRLSHSRLARHDQAAAAAGAATIR